MTRLVISFLLSFGFLLARGTDHLSLPAAKAVAGIGTIAGFSQPADPAQHLHKSDAAAHHSESVPATEVEDEDEDFSSGRRYIEIVNYFLSFFYVQDSGHPHRYLKIRLPFCRHFSYTASDKHIVQRVIRI